MAEVYLDIISHTEKIQADMKNVQTEMGKLGTKSEQVNKTMRTEFESTGRVAGELKGMITGLFTIGAITAFLKKIIDVRMEWEKQTAVIKTLTGSQKEAEATMQMLKKVSDASLSPLKEVSDAYIRLANQGIKPTYAEMKKMVDVAVSAGRSFGQLAEAIFDATNGQVRGLRDFGIQSKIQGDKIQLSFKGMTETVKLTGDAIADFVIKAGGLEGVRGASEEINKTIVGAFDNLGDSVETVVLNLGKLTDKSIVDVVNSLNDIVTVIGFLSGKAAKAGDSTLAFVTNFLKQANPILQLYKGTVWIYGKLADLIRKDEESIEDFDEATGDAGESIDDFAKKIKDLVADMAKGLPEISIKDIMGLGTENEVKSFIKAFDTLKGSLSGKDLDEANIKLYWLNQRLKELEGQGLKELTPEIVMEKTKSIDGLVKSINKINYPDTTKLKKTKDEDIAIDEQLWQEKLENSLKYFDEVSDLIDGLSRINMLAMDNELKKAEGNEAKQLEIRKKYAKKEQSISIMKAIISGAEGIIKTGANLGYPIAIPFQIAQGIETAIEIALIRAQKFATGILDLQGRGTGTSDSIPSMLSRGESVMTAKETKEYYPYLKAMKEGKFPKLQMELMSDFAKLKVSSNLNYDNSKEIRKLEEIKRVLLRDQQSETIEGRYRIIRRGGITTKISLN